MHAYKSQGSYMFYIDFDSTIYNTHICIASTATKTCMCTVICLQHSRMVDLEVAQTWIEECAC